MRLPFAIGPYRASWGHAHPTRDDRHQSNADAAAIRPGRSADRVAVFTNCYPKTSHTFIRNEIAALERQGFDVLRITIRPSSEGLVDPADRSEASRTLALFGSGMAGAVFARAAKAPWRFFRTFGMMIADSGRSTGLLRGVAYFVEACRLIEVMEAAHVGHVHVHFGTNPATIARFASKLGAVTYSVTVHGPDEFDAPRALMLPEKIADARFVAAISDYGRSQLMRWSDPAHWARIKVVRCGVADTFHAGGADDAGLRSRTLVCVARLSAQKGIPLLLEAVEQLARPETFDLRIVGDGELRASLETAIAARGLQDHVHLLGWRDADGVRRELLQARALILPSFAEGLPVVLMEALALGRPVVATAIAGIPELVDSSTGWLIRAGSASALAEAIRAALHTDAEALQAMAAVGRARVRRHHDVDANAAALASLIRASVG